MQMQYVHLSHVNQLDLCTHLVIWANLFLSLPLLTVIRSILVIKPLNHVNNLCLSLQLFYTFTTPFLHPFGFILPEIPTNHRFSLYRQSHSCEQNVEWITNIDTQWQQQHTQKTHMHTFHSATNSFHKIFFN